MVRELRDIVSRIARRVPVEYRRAVGRGSPTELRVCAKGLPEVFTLEIIAESEIDPDVMESVLKSVSDELGYNVEDVRRWRTGVKACLIEKGSEVDVCFWWLRSKLMED